MCDSVPLVPVTATWNVPADVKVHDSVELPVAATLVGFTLQEVLLVERLTTATKPFWSVIVIVEVAVDPALAVILAGLAVKVKSRTWNRAVAVWVSEPLVPVIDRV